MSQVDVVVVMGGNTRRQKNIRIQVHMENIEMSENKCQVIVVDCSIKMFSISYQRAALWA